MTQPEARFDVVVVGAGISGLAVASALNAAGVDVAVLEARDRIGGRIYSVGGWLDLGPTWFWPGEKRVVELAASLGVAVHDHFDSGAALYAMDNTFRAVEVDMPPSFRFTNGAAALVDGLHALLPENRVRLGVTVEQISTPADLGDAVRLETSDGGILAGTVVIALPPSLAMHSGMVDPQTLPTETAAAATQVPVWMGDTVKAVAVYERPFWRDAGLSGMISARNVPFHEVHDMSGPEGLPAALFGFGSSPSSSGALDGELFVRQLTAIFGDDAASPMETWSLDWGREAFTSPPGPPNRRFDLFGSPHLAAPAWGGRLHWSSTETGQVAPGHIEGALQAAERTVRAILQKPV